MRTSVLLCSTLVALCLAVQPTGRTTEHAIALVGDVPVAGERPTDIEEADSSAPPFWPPNVNPRPLSVPDAEYPRAVRKAHIEGLAVVEALVDISGWVADVRILKSSGNGSLDQEALAAASEAKFSPAMARAWPVKWWVTMPYRFVLTSGIGTAPASSVSVVTGEVVAPPSAVRNYSDSVLKPLRGLTFVRLKPIAPRDGAHGRLVPDSTAIRFNNEAMMAAFAAFRSRRGDSLRRPASYYLQSDWYYLVVDSGRCRVFQRNHPHHPYSRVEIYNLDRLAVRPASLNADYVEIPGWTTLPQYVPLKIEFAAGEARRTIQVPTFALEVQ